MAISMNMKASKYIAILMIATGVMTACDKHDSLDEQVFIGKMAPQVYWEVPSTTVSAGDDVAFSAQYYTTGDRPVSYCEVWYNTIETEDKQVSAPWVTCTTYSIVSSSVTERMTESGTQVKYMHDEANWNAKQRAYQFKATFPTSYTKSKTEWKNKEWDSTLVVRYFGENFMQHFKDSLETILKADLDKSYVDYKTLYIAKGGDERIFISQYTDSAFNDNTQTYDKFFKNHELPAAVDSLYQACTFGDLIDSKGEKSISYKKQYSLKATLRCYDDQGTYGFALYKEIKLN